MRRRLPYRLGLSGPPWFPEDLEPDQHGLVAVGGWLDVDILLEAYRKGIFPWEDDPVPFWFSPDPRMVLYPSDHHVSERLARRIRRREMAVDFDVGFEEVILACATTPRPGQGGTWISGGFRSAYTELHRRGYAHCVSVRREGVLVGGLYGLSIGACFFGESMFSRVSDASKIAVYHLVAWCRARGFAFIDCQAPTPHLQSLGAQPIPRRQFLGELAAAVAQPTLRGPWTDEAAGLSPA